MSHIVKEPLPASSRSRYCPAYPNTLIIIPAFNEAKNLGAVLDGIQAELPGMPVVVINDGSGDDTAEVAARHGAKVISLPYNSGYGVALQTGFIYAVQNGYSSVVHMDGDRQHDPQSIKSLLKEIQKDEVDVAIGSRFIGECRYKASLARRIGMLIFGRLASLIIRQEVSDPTSGFQAVKGRAIEFMASDFYPPDYPDADFIILLHRFGFRTCEVPVMMHQNNTKVSMHRGHKTIYYVFKMFLSIIVTLLREKPKRA